MKFRIVRDIKPSNIPLTPDGIKVADFGLPRASGSKSDSRLIAGHRVSPEQGMGRRWTSA